MLLQIALPDVESQDELQRVLDFLADECERQVRKHRLPHPFLSGARYKREPVPRERWQTALETLQRGEADCEDLSAYLCGWLRAHGTPARAVLRPSSLGYHAIVESQGQTIDPSRYLGMK